MREDGPTRPEFEAMKQQQAATFKMVQEMHQGLMEPQPGHKEGLLSRMALVTIKIESGERVTAMVLRAAIVLSAIGGAVATINFWGPK